MGYYELYKKKILNSGGNFRQEKIDERFEILSDTFFDSIEYTPVTINDSTEIIHTWVYNGDRTSRDNGSKRIKSYPYETVKFDKGDYVYFKYGGEDTTWMIEGLDIQYNFNVIGTMYRCYRDRDLKWIDKNGKLHSMPCVIKKNTLGTNFDLDIPVILTDGTIYVDVQKNQYTDTITSNDRFLFDKQAFKVTFNETFIGGNYSTLTMVKDSIAPDDDLINNIANVNRYKYTLSINQPSFTETVGHTQQLTATLKLNNVITTESLTWSTSDPVKATIDTNGNLSLLSVGTVTITCSLTGNPNVNSQITVTIISTPINSKSNEISPQTNFIYLNSTQSYNVISKTNGVLNTDTFTVSVSGLDQSYYRLTVLNGNSFSIQNLKSSNTKITVNCTNNTDGTIVSLPIALKGKF